VSWSCRHGLPALGGTALVLCSLTLGAAQAVVQPSTAPVPTYAMPPVPDPLLHPTAAPIAPDSPTARTNVECVKASPGTPGEIKAPPWAQAQLRFADAWPLSRGAGVRVAVIDTGVNPHPRLGARLEPGGDYVSNTPGTTDCDGHGTIVAGIIAASADPTERTGFAGVAPDATLISIRQTSKYYDEVAKGSGDEPGYGNLSTLARSVVRAVDLKAKVINISEAACGPATKVLNDGALGAALKYAVDNDVVIVAAAGNTGSTDAGSCKNQNATNPAQPGVPGKSPVATIASPAWYSDYVLAVGAMARDGTASKFSLAGPWVGVAGPGEDITSLDPAPGSVGLSNRLAETPGAQLGPIQGTSFAAPYVAGTAALVRARFPSLSAKQVVQRIKVTAHTPPGGWSPTVGYGMVDPVAAVADVLPSEGTAQSARDSTTRIPPPVAPKAPDTTPRTVAFAGSAAALAAVVLTFAVLDATRRHRRRADGPG
jgi:membrane-anchored mycosin MYCP